MYTCFIQFYDCGNGIVDIFISVLQNVLYHKWNLRASLWTTWTWCRQVICQHYTRHAQIRWYTHNTTILRLCGFCLGQLGWASTRRNIHPLTPIVVIKYPYLPPPSTTIHGILPIQSMCFTVFFHNLQVFFGLPLGLAPSTSYSIHFFIQSLSSFRSTCPYHRNLFCCSTEIMSSNPSLSLNSTWDSIL